MPALRWRVYCKQNTLACNWVSLCLNDSCLEVKVIIWNDFIYRKTFVWHICIYRKMPTASKIIKI